MHKPTDEYFGKYETEFFFLLNFRFIKIKC